MQLKRIAKKEKYHSGVDKQEHRTKIEKNIDRKGSCFDSICCQVNTSTSESNSVMATEFILIQV